MRRDKNTLIGKNIKRRLCNLSAQKKGAKPFLMPDEEHLCGFSQMGFHINYCLYVSLINVFMSISCMLQISKFEYVAQPLLHKSNRLNIC